MVVCKWGWKIFVALTKSQLTELLISFSCRFCTIWYASGLLRGSGFQHCDIKAYISAVQFWGIGSIRIMKINIRISIIPLHFNVLLHIGEIDVAIRQTAEWRDFPDNDSESPNVGFLLSKYKLVKPSWLWEAYPCVLLFHKKLRRPVSCAIIFDVRIANASNFWLTLISYQNVCSWKIGLVKSFLFFSNLVDFRV